MANTEVKICGLTNRDDAAAAAAAGADYLGFVLYSGSPRGITAMDLARILDKLENMGNLVGVFVNEPRASVEKTAVDCGLCAVQIHGDEGPEGFVDFPVPVWRAVCVEGSTASPSPRAWPAARYVVDAAVAGMYGGTGQAADRDAAARLAAELPVMLAGGLRPDNVAAAVRAVRPLGVDTASGVEAEPGKKDHAKLKAFIEAVRNCDQL
jgi:phosphoribosylanthranilate isomerase